VKQLLGMGVALIVLGGGLTATAAEAQTTVRVCWPARTLTTANAPWAIATKLGWYEKLGVKIEVVPLAGGGDCARALATGQTMFSLQSAEPIAILRAQGAKLKTFYTAYQRSIYGIAVPTGSPIKAITDIKDKKVGVISMSSAGAIIVRSLAKEHGFDPDKDITVVVAGEAAQTAALLRNGSVDALSQFDTQYALVENAGIKLRRLVHPSIDNFPGHGFVALEETLTKNRKEAIAIAKGYAMGTLFALHNPEGAVRLLWENWPQTKSTSKDETTALALDVATLNARAESAWRLEPVGAKKWGEHLIANHEAYYDWLVANGAHKKKASTAEMLDSSLIDEINDFDATAVIKAAKEWRPK
jgi:NitT/TauT family transport system substrate-binding protein